MPTWFRVIALVSPLLAGACGREHLSAAFGRANREAFGAQVVRPRELPTPPPSMGLDTQEAGVIGSSYVQSLAGKSAKAEPQPVLYVAPEQPGAGSQRLAPSVPKQ
jgi:hypothetical protein